MRDQSTGLECPKCGCRDLRVWMTRRERSRIRRVRICRHCGQRVISYEAIDRPAAKKGPVLDKS